MEKFPKKAFEKFLSKDGLKKKKDEWSLDAAGREAQGPIYKFARTDDGNKENIGSIDTLHGVSFIKEVIPKLIAKKKEGEKVRILDIGAGAAYFTDQIRKSFPGKVIVYSTGLSKKIAKEYRKDNKSKEEAKLHPNDLKWRSVLELSDYPEFDLIIDTFGEFQYTISEFTPDRNIPIPPINMTEYLTVVVRKLKPGGLASIVARNISNYLMSENKIEFQLLEKEYNVKITPMRGLIRIEKKNKV